MAASFSCIAVLVVLLCSATALQLRGGDEPVLPELEVPSVLMSPSESFAKDETVTTTTTPAPPAAIVDAGAASNVIRGLTSIAKVRRSAGVYTPYHVSPTKGTDSTTLGALTRRTTIKLTYHRYLSPFPSRPSLFVLQTPGVCVKLATSNPAAILR
jgi:hypothetical protein